MSFGTTKPVHDQMSAVGTGTAFNNFQSYYDVSTTGNDGLTAVGTGTAFNSFAESTFEVIVNSGILVLIDDALNIHDSMIYERTYFVEEPLNIDDHTLLQLVIGADDPLDIADSSLIDLRIAVDEELNIDDDLQYFGPTAHVDSINIEDEFRILLDILQDDSIDIDDLVYINVVPDGGFEDSIDIADSLLISRDILGDDSVNIHDSVSFLALFKHDDSININDSVTVRRTYHKSFGTEVQLRHHYEKSFGTETQISHFDPPPLNGLVGVGGGAGGSNPTNPSISIDGTVITSNPETYRPAQSTQISLDYGALGCDIFQFTISASLSGGSFSIKSQTAKGSVGAILSFFGIPCLITNADKYSDNSGHGFITEGVIGDARKLNQQLLLAATGPAMASVQKIMPTPLQTPPSLQWQTVSGLAAAIAAAAGIDLSWQTIDAPLTDAFLETGMAIGDALRSLAGRVGGVLIPTGNATTWVVTDLVSGYGGWNGIPNCALWGPGGLVGGVELNMSAQSVLFPINALSGGSAVFEDNPLTKPPPPPVLPLSQRTTIIGDDAPMWLIPIPRDFGAVSDGTLQYKIVLKPGSPNAALGVAYGVLETDTQTWFDIAPTIVKHKDGTLWAQLDKTFIDNRLTEGDFTAIAGYIRDESKSDAAVKQAFQDALARKKLLDQSELERIRYFRIGRGQAQFTFFGSLPLPGNKSNFSFGGVSSTGIVESMSLSYPGNLVSLQMGQYVRVDLTTPRSYLDYYLATGSTGP